MLNIVLRCRGRGEELIRTLGSDCFFSVSSLSSHTYTHREMCRKVLLRGSVRYVTYFSYHKVLTEAI